MPRFSLGILLVSTFFTPLHLSAHREVTGDTDEAQEGRIIPGEYIVLLKAAVQDEKRERLEEIMAKHKIKIALQIYEKLKGFQAALTDEQLAELRADPEVELVEPDYEITAFAQKLPTGINRGDADVSPLAAIDGNSSELDVDIAILDTGVDKHGDLNVVQRVNFSADSSKYDLKGHGTHVAGTAAAKDNSSGVVGMAPGARIWSVKVLDRNGSGKLSGLIKGIDYVTAHADEIEVANMSLGCYKCQTKSMDTAIARSVAAGVVYTVAAGNSAKDAKDFSPANHPDVISVSAISDYDGIPGGKGKPSCGRNDRDDTLASYSNYGSTVDIAAPGTCILSTWKGGGYQVASGTSMASPHVAGAAALYILKHGKPRDASGVHEVMNGLKSIAAEQNGDKGFNGGRSGEPLLNVEQL